MIVRDLEYILNQLHITYYSDWLHSSLTINDTIVSIIHRANPIPSHPSSSSSSSPCIRNLPGRPKESLSVTIALLVNAQSESQSQSQSRINDIYSSSQPRRANHRSNQLATTHRSLVHRPIHPPCKARQSKAKQERLRSTATLQTRQDTTRQDKTRQRSEASGNQTQRCKSSLPFPSLPNQRFPEEGDDRD